MKEKIIFSWSSGKDSAFALWEILKSDEYEVFCLFTVVSEEYGRVGFHGVPLEVLKKQAESIGIPLKVALISKSDSIEDYAEKFKKAVLELKTEGITKIAYGDIFLEDLKEFRIKHMNEINMTGIFPIWKQDTTELSKKIVKSGFKAMTTCIDSKLLDEKYIGRVIDEGFLSDLPKNIDPCGENGEFHTFVFDGPIFQHKVNFLKGQTILRDGFYYCDLTNNILNENNLEKINSLAPEMQKEVLKFAEICQEQDILFEIVSARRSFEEEQEAFDEYWKDYYDEPLSKDDKGCHQLGLAIDIKIGNSLSYIDEYAIAGKIWQNMGHTWLGDDKSKEYWHFQYAKEDL